jgi:hypothetical protein
MLSPCCYSSRTGVFKISPGGREIITIPSSTSLLLITLEKARFLLDPCRKHHRKQEAPQCMHGDVFLE